MIEWKAGILAFCAALALGSSQVVAGEGPLKLLDQKALQPVGVNLSEVTYRGSRAVRLVADRPDADTDTSIARLQGVLLKDFSIEVVLAGRPIANDTDARGFVGIAFRMSPDAGWFEAIYIRPTNGRSDDQVRRNHSTQYISHPDYPWYRLRKESPGQYESYVDLASGEWTKLKLVVRGASARLYVNDAPQPALIVNDLKLPPSEGGIGLWVGPGSEGYFKTVRITETRP